MDNARDNLQFSLSPCPKCGQEITVADVVKMEDGGGGYGILHDCPTAPGKGICCYGWNVRMTVQNWNLYIKEYAEWQHNQENPM